jgi:hypothetical protein
MVRVALSMALRWKGLRSGGTLGGCRGTPQGSAWLQEKEATPFTHLQPPLPHCIHHCGGGMEEVHPSLTLQTTYA